MTLKERKLQYIYKQAFDYLPHSIPQDSIQDNTECTTMVNIALSQSTRLVLIIASVVIKTKNVKLLSYYCCAGAKCKGLA
jgi:hypothetical protein